MIPARDALKRLRDGNRRFTSHLRDSEIVLNRSRSAELTQDQEPFAIVLGCSDSRVPAEIVFDQGLGDLFVIRVAGNIVAPPRSAASSSPPSGSARGWWSCSATRSAAPSWPPSRICRSRPTNQTRFASHRGPRAAFGRGTAGDRASTRPAALVRGGSGQHPRLRGPPATRLAGARAADPEDGLVVVGAEYSLETGVVEFFDGEPESA